MIKTTINTLVDSAFNTTIDTVQTSKKIFVDTFVKHKELAKSLNEFVDTQTEYTKNAVNHTVKLGKTVQEHVTNPEFYREIVSSAKDYTKTFVDAYKTQRGK